MFGRAKGAPPDPILGMRDAFNVDTAKDKLNLAVGVYRTAEGQPLVLKAVQDAEIELLCAQQAGKTFKEYLPPDGMAPFCDASLRLLFGDTIEPALREKRVVAAQSLSGTGALGLAAHMIAKLRPGVTVYLPGPTWPIHPGIFSAAGVPVGTYTYYDQTTCGLDFDRMLNELSMLPRGSIVLLHSCAHNPTGVDPSTEQWAQIAQTIQARNLVPLIDSAYQGLASGDLEEDAAGARAIAALPGIELLVAQSYSKNLGLYGERAGCFAMFCNEAGVAERCGQELRAAIRFMYSSPPQHGAAIVHNVLTTPQRCAAWKAEVASMAARLRDMRTALFAALKEIDCPPPHGTRLTSWAHVVEQRGMFTYTGLTAVQVDLLRTKHHVYMPQDGRISMAGLNAMSCKTLAAAIKDALIETAPCDTQGGAKRRR